MKVLFAPEAEADLAATLEWVRERNPSAALKLAKRVFGTMQNLARGKVDGPAYQLVSGESVRSWLIPPFRVFYVRHGDELHVLRVYHHARRPITR